MDPSSVPLADYFWVAGVELLTYDDGSQTNAQVDIPIAEDGEPENENPAPNGSYRVATARHSRQNSANRLSKLSFDGRSTPSILDGSDDTTRSNRSSATIKAAAAPSAQNGSAPPAGDNTMPMMGDFDFDKALVKFAAEREDFLDDLSFSAGARVQSRQPMVNPRAERIRADDVPSGRMSPLKSLKGSFRRKISFREMSSSRKQHPAGRSSGNSKPCTLIPGSMDNSSVTNAVVKHSFCKNRQTFEQLQFRDASS